MSDFTAPKRYKAHLRGHSLPLAERARRDYTIADKLANTDGEFAVGDLFDGEMLVVDGDQIASFPIPGGGGGGGDITAVVAGAGLTGGASTGIATLSVDFGTAAAQVRPGNDATYTDARTPLAHTHVVADVTGAVPSTRTLSVGLGVLGGGDLSANRSFQIDPATVSQVGHTHVVANVTGAVADTRQVATGTGLLGGGDLSANRTLTPDFGTGAGKVTQGNDSRLSDARTPTAHVHAASDVTSGTLDLARMTAGTANQLLRVNSGGTAIEGYNATPSNIEYLAANQTLASGAQDTTFAARTVTSGRTYRYRLSLFIKSVSAAPTLTLGHFTTAATASEHERLWQRWSGGAPENKLLSDASLTTSFSVSAALTSVNIFLVIVEGQFICTGSGTVLPRATTSAVGLVIKAGSTFQLNEI